MLYRKTNGNSSIQLAAVTLTLALAVWFIAPMMNANSALAAPNQAAKSQPKSEAQQTLDRIVQNLRQLDTAYASGNTAEAQSKYEAAESDWKTISPKISAREGREVQLLFESLGKKLKNKAPAKEVAHTVRGTIEELREDIGRELRKQ